MFRDVRPSNRHLSPGEKATLIAAAQYTGGVTREQASILTGYERSSGDAYMQRLQSRGYVELDGGNVVATSAGVKALGSDFEPSPTGKDLQRYWLERRPPGEKAVLELAVYHHPNAVDRVEIDNVTGLQAIEPRRLHPTVAGAAALGQGRWPGSGQRGAVLVGSCVVVCSFDLCDGPSRRPVPDRSSPPPMARRSAIQCTGSATGGASRAGRRTRT